jgi:Antibiotic biosynthesis monooxygenase
MKFQQAISFRSTEPGALVALLDEWDRAQASTEVMGYIGTRLLADRDDPGHYLIMAEFAEVDGDLSPAEEAERNNQREATRRWAEKLRALADDEPDWTHFDELYRTGLTGNLRTG